MRILITGNLGYIGTELTKYFKLKLNKSYLIGVDNNYFSNKLISTKENPNIYVDHQYNIDIRDIKSHHFKNVDAVIHLAAISNDPIGNKFETLTNQINFKESIKIAKLCIKNNVKKFVFASSCSVYGLNDISSKNENDALNPLTAYAKSKINTEMYLKKNLSNKGTAITCLRFATACGYSDRIRLDLVLNDFVCDAFLTKKINIMSDGLPWRPIIDVIDMCRAINWGVDRKSNSNFLTVNVGSQRCNVQIKNLAEIVKKTIGNCEINIHGKNKSDKRSYKVNFSLFNKLAKQYKPKISIRKSIENILDGLERYSFKNNFIKEDFIRLKNLEMLINKSKIDKSLRWRILNK